MVSRLEGVIQVVEASGQFQVVLGSKVNKIYDQAVALLGGEMVGEGDVEVPAEKQSFGNLLIQKLGEIFTPWCLPLPRLASSRVCCPPLPSWVGWTVPPAPM